MFKLNLITDMQNNGPIDLTLKQLMHYCQGMLSLCKGSKPATRIKDEQQLISVHEWLQKDCISAAGLPPSTLDA